MLFMIVAMMSSASFSQSVKEEVRQQIETNNLYIRLANAKVSKDAKKRAKADAKDGWKVMAGEKSLDRQYTESDVYGGILTANQYGNQVPRYMAHTGMATGKTYNMAYTDAREQSKFDIAGQLETQIVGSIKESMESQKLSDNESAAVEKLSGKIASLVNASLSFLPIGTSYRLNNDIYEVRVRLVCDRKEFFDKLKMQMLKESGVSDELLDQLLNDALDKTASSL